MNRLVLIGNGFDLAHGLKTSYADFIYWYWEQRRNHFVNESNPKISEDVLCKIECLEYDTWLVALMYDIKLKNSEGKEVYDYIINSDKYKIEFSPFFERILKSIDTKGWVDIENEFYELLKDYVLRKNDVSEVEKLNFQLKYLQDKLVEYLKFIEISDSLMNNNIRREIYTPFHMVDISIEGQQAIRVHIDAGLKLDDIELDRKFNQFNSHIFIRGRVTDYKNKIKQNGYSLEDNDIPLELLLPNHIMLLNFNYTYTADLYLKRSYIFSVNKIHGSLDNPSSVIFGYGDELDKDYKEIVNKNDNKLLGKIKSIKYLEADNYRKMLSFIESEPFQVIIMGHSCGNSDRTLLHTIFEHKNCVSIKPYYYINNEGKDNYIDLVQNISRNFTDMKLMRDRVVNKTYCKPLT